LDEGAVGLPEEYRAASARSYLEGLTTGAAARQLGWPAGAMSARLARGRELLRARLQRRTRRYLAPFPFLSWLTGQASAAPVPAGPAARVVEQARTAPPAGRAWRGAWLLGPARAPIVLLAPVTPDALA